MPKLGRANARQTAVADPKSYEHRKLHEISMAVSGSPIYADYRIVETDDLPDVLMRVFAWSCIAGGVLLGVVAFVITANSPANPRPTLLAGFSLTMVGVIALALKRVPKP